MAFLSPFVSRPIRCTSHASKSGRCEMNLGRVLVLGGTHGVGLSIVRLLRAHSGVNRVIAAGGCETSGMNQVENYAHDVVTLDVTSEESVEEMLEVAKPQTLISNYAHSKGIRNVMNMVHDDTRFVLISALGCGDSETDVPAQVYFSMRDKMVDMSLAEVYVRESRLKWTIARPGPSNDGNADGQAILTEGHKCYGTINNNILADTIVKCAESTKTIGRTLAMVDRNEILLTSPFVRPLEVWESFPFDEFVL